MKLLFENWREYLKEETFTVHVEYPDNIPPELLATAEEDEELAGFVYPDEPERSRA